MQSNPVVARVRFSLSLEPWMCVCVVCIFAKSNQPHAIKLDNYDVLTYFNAVLWNGIFMRMNYMPLCMRL